MRMVDPQPRVRRPAGGVHERPSSCRGRGRGQRMNGPDCRRDFRPDRAGSGDDRSDGPGHRRHRPRGRFGGHSDLRRVGGAGRPTPDIARPVAQGSTGADDVTSDSAPCASVGADRRGGRSSTRAGLGAAAPIRTPRRGGRPLPRHRPSSLIRTQWSKSDGGNPCPESAVDPTRPPGSPCAFPKSGHLAVV